MTREDIIKLARNAAKEFGSWDDWDSDKPASGPNGNDPYEEREYWISLVEFITAAEREACAKMCESDAVLTHDPVATADNCAAAIRARSQT